MADYFPLIARAVAGLERNSGENRRALYERARTALVAQLRSVSPALNEADITRERLALEDAIRKVEGEASRRSREAPDGGDWDRGDAGDLRSPPPVPPRPSLGDEGLKGFREVVAEAEGLGDASAQTAKSAREVYGEVADGVPHPGELHDDHGAPPLDAGPPFFSEPSSPERHQRAPHEGAPFPAAPEDSPQSFEPPTMAEPLPAPTHSEQWPEPLPAPSRYDDRDEGYERPRRSFRRLIKIVVILLLIGAIAGAGYWQRAALMALVPKVTALVSSMRSSPPAPAPSEIAPARQKIADRVGGDSAAGRSATAPTADVAQKVVLYDEDNNDPQGKRYVGSAIWRTETVSPGPGLAPELAIRADVDIPERHMRMTWSLRRNSDKALPASHTIEIMFTLAADFADGGIANVPGVLMKQNEQTRGVPLAGLAVKVTNGFFLIGLSAVDVDLQRNVQLLKERSWFDVPLVYNTGKRAILAIEKGTPGERVFEEAFRTWAQ
jgi:hypothetical protein